MERGLVNLLLALKPTDLLPLLNEGLILNQLLFQLPKQEFPLRLVRRMKEKIQEDPADALPLGKLRLERQEVQEVS